MEPFPYIPQQVLVSQHGIFLPKATIKRLLLSLSFTTVYHPSFFQLCQMFVQADHLVYFNFNWQRQKVFTPTVLLHDFFPVMRSNWLTGIQSAPCVLWGSFSEGLSQQAAWLSNLKSTPKRCQGRPDAAFVWHILGKSEICVHTYHIRTIYISAKSTQINVQAPRSLRGCTEVSGHLAALCSAAFAFHSMFNTQLPPWQAELPCILALNEHGCQTGYIPRSRLGISISNRLMFMLIF